VKPELQSRSRLEQRNEGRCILVVDDETLIRELCGRVLDGYQVLQAANGAEALEILRQQSVDVVLTDVMMPDIDGLTLLQKAKEIDPTQVVIVMTGFADKDVVLQALRENADDLLTKPLNLLQLKTTISKALDKKRLKEELVYLRRMDRLKSDFLGLVSHKLKTPFTAISLFLQNLADTTHDPEDPDFRHHLALILQESRYLQGLIDDLLQHSDIVLRHHAGEPSEVNSGELLHPLAAQYETRAAALGLRFSTLLPAPLPTLFVDPDGFRVAVSALLDNALKFSPPGSEVTLSARVDEGELHIHVSDQGQGIPVEEAPKVIEKFYQIDPHTTGQVRGFGLGLYYANTFARFHRGSLRIGHTPQGGALVSLSLPL